MRIHELNIENIASLRGRHNLNFEQDNLINSLFAITGPTGSGKSTLLNCISLALYGRLYKRNLNQADVVTLGEGQGSIELTFSLGAQKYLSRWSCRVKQKNGKDLKKPEILPRILYKIHHNERIVVDNSAEEILNLDYDQFTKTTILNQGDFSKFLTSKFIERREILEKLSNFENLSQLNPTLREIVKELKSKKENIEESMALLKGDEPIDLEVLKKEYKNLQSEFEKYASYKDILTSFQLNLKEILDKHLEITKNKLRKDEITTSITEQTTFINKLNEELRLAQSKLEESKIVFDQKSPILEECILKQEKIKGLKQNLSSIEVELNKSQGRIKDLEVSINKTKEQLKLKDCERVELTQSLTCTTIDDCEPLALENILASYKINNLEKEKIINELKYINQEIETKKESNYLKQQQVQKIEENIGSLLYDLGHIEEDQLNLLFEKNEKHIESISREIQKIKFFYDQCREDEKLIQDLEQENKLHTKNKDKLTQNNILLKKDYQHILELKNNKAYQDQLLSVIQKSLDQKSCEVCGNDDLSAVQLPKIQDNKKHSHEYLNELLLSIQANEAKILKSESSLNFNKVKIEKIQADFKNVYYEIDQFDSKELFAEKVESIEEIEKFLSFLNDHMKSQLQNIEKLKEARKTYIELSHKKDSLNSQVEELNQSIKNNQSKIDKLQSHNDELTKTRSQIDKKVLELIPNYVAENIESNLIIDTKKLIQLKSLQLEINSDQEKLQLFEKNQMQVQSDIEGFNKNIDKFSSEINILLTEIKSQIQDNDPRKLLEETKESIEHARKEERKVYDELQLLLRKLKSSEASLAHINDQIHQLEQKIINLDDELKSNLKPLKSINSDHPCTIFKDKIFSAESSEMANFIDININILELYFKQITETLNEFNEVYKDKDHTLIRKQANIQNLKAKEDKIAELNKQLTALNKNLSLKLKLQELIGKDEFRNYVLKIIEQNLIIQTNSELNELCGGRYQIDQITKNQKIGPEFFVVDKFNGAMTRNISTLSGGETFLVSLAMALALAELTRGKSEVDCFFIDEGFGTLDKDSLDEVVEILNSIQGQGKQIGIISHIKDLTDRIPINIGLNKNQYGNSTISLTLN